MNDQMNFNDDFSMVVPDGAYPSTVVGTEWKTSQAGADYLNVEFAVLGESYANARVFEMFHLFNQNKTAKRIAMARMQSLLECMGYEKGALESVTKQKLVDLIAGKIVTIETKIEKDAQYGDKNKVKKFMKCAAGVQPSAQPNFSADDIPF